MVSQRKALITGGANGLGLAVAKSLLADGWLVSILDVNSKLGEEAASSLGSGATFYPADVTDFSQLSQAFEKVFEEHHRLDFVFANAGIVSPTDFYAPTSATTPPNFKTIDVVLKGVINTSYLARHYFAQVDNQAAAERKDLVVTASTGGFYGVAYDPLYGAAKHGVVGFVRSIASHYKKEGIYVNAVCPSLMKTGILPEQIYAAFPEAMLTPVPAVVERVRALLEDEKVGQTIECFRDQHFARTQIEYCAPEMAALMGVVADL